VTVAHDSYERLVEVPCNVGEHQRSSGTSGLGPLKDSIDKPTSIGVDLALVAEAAALDPAIAEFCRFYTERKAEEIKAAKDDPRKRQKLEDDFTPRLEMTVVGLEGQMRRQIELRATYQLGDDAQYTSMLTVTPSTEALDQLPRMGQCARTGRTVPEDALGKCAVSRAQVMKHFLVQSGVSNRVALPDHMLVCGVSGKRIISDEAERSAVTGKHVARSLLKTSEVSGKRGEPEFFGQCEFTRVAALTSELAVSEASRKRYRADEQMRSAVSGKTGHRSEFIECSETKRALLPAEAEQCEVTRQFVVPGSYRRKLVTDRIGKAAYRGVA
jgi:hypothetical protein